MNVSFLLPGDLGALPGEAGKSPLENAMAKAALLAFYAEKLGLEKRPCPRSVD